MEAAVTDLETRPATSRFRNLVALFGPTLFLSAFLLFCFEPMVGKMMLPFLGGAASVWITCLLFFQLMLLTGYGYAHALERYAADPTQLVTRITLMDAAVAFLPIQFATRTESSANLTAQRRFVDDTPKLS